MKNEITLQLVMVWPDRKQEHVQWTGIASATPGLCVILKPRLDLALRRARKSGWVPELDNWQVVHIRSGFPVRAYHLKSKAAALQLASDLGDVTDWTQDARSICNVSVAVTRARSAWIDRLYKRAGAVGVPTLFPG